MKISGLQKTTLLDYPGHVAATIFLSGCNFRCPFCHNMNLVLGQLTDESDKTSISDDELFDFLRKRQGVLEGVCITGGEPTLYKDLPELLQKIKDLGYLIKLDTNGSNPDMIKDLYNKNLIDYIAMDIKSSFSNYIDICGLSEILSDEQQADLLKNISESIQFIMSCGIEYEFRTTAIKQYHTMEVMNEIGNMLGGAKRYFIQEFKDSEFVINHELSAVDRDTMKEYESLLSDYIEEVRLRGID